MEGNLERNNFKRTFGDGPAGKEVGKMHMLFIPTSL